MRTRAPSIPGWSPAIARGSALEARNQRRHSTGVTRGVWIGAAVLAVVWIALLYALSWHSFAGNSDEANAVLAGHAIAKGNLWLHGWRLPADTYWPFDLGTYALFTGVAGVGQAAYHAVPTAIFVAAVALAVTLAGRDSRGRRRIVAAGVTFVIVGLPSPVLADFVLQGPAHVGSALLCLVAFALLRSRTFGWQWVMGVAALALALLGDPIVYAIGIAPLVVAGVARAARTRRASVALHSWAASSAAVVTAVAGRALLSAAGQTTAPPLPITPSHFVRNASVLFKALANVYGVGNLSRLSGVLQSVRAVGFALVAVAIVVSSLMLVRSIGLALLRTRPAPSAEPDRPWLDDVLVLAFWGGLGAFVITATSPTDGGNWRYLTPSVIFAAVLAGRVVARLRVPRVAPAARLVAAGAGLALAFLFLVSSIGRVGEPQPVGLRPLATWLEAHSLRRGVGPYWDASIITVGTKEEVSTRAVTFRDGLIRPYRYYADSTPVGRHQGPLSPTFLVYEPARPWGGVDARAATSAFGRPTSTTRIGMWEVLVWDHDIFAQLGPPTDRP